MKKKPMTVEEHQASRMISDPFRLFDCSLESDGGCAFVVSSTERAQDMRQPVVRVLGIAEGHPDSPSAITHREDMTTLGIAKAAPKVFRMADVGHDDIDVAEIYGLLLPGCLSASWKIWAFARRAKAEPM